MLRRWSVLDETGARDSLPQAPYAAGQEQDLASVRESDAADGYPIHHAATT